MSIRYSFGLKSFTVTDVADDFERRNTFPTFVKSMHDLAEALDVEPTKLGFNETLSINIGSSAKGLAGPFYNREHRLLNLSETSGPFCLAHEWFHAFDAYVGGRDHGWTKGVFAELVAKIQSLPLYERTTYVDENMGLFYFRKQEELTARAFESYVNKALAGKGKSNEYLVCTDGQELVYCTDDELAELAPLIETLIDMIR